MKPQRIQLSRKKGFDLQTFSRELNGLPAKKIDRMTAFGNPFPFESRGKTWAFKQHRRWIWFKAQRALRAKIRAELYGYNLACWCRLDECCHGITLLDISNSS